MTMLTSFTIILTILLIIESQSYSLPCSKKVLICSNDHFRTNILLPSETYKNHINQSKINILSSKSSNTKNVPNFDASSIKCKSKWYPHYIYCDNEAKSNE